MLTATVAYYPLAQNAAYDPRGSQCYMIFGYLIELKVCGVLYTFPEYEARFK